ncbi:SDR family oxidoreductase [Halieaceae bacterium IMCC14734]|uniref:SDR family oxidoreductase n=1 Tax=Candidatus Litorirhabdus singularis TaxID=2518993 RepID=A0ABT3TIM4_9GAMM|nr:oxidoreductase [Candidatus Litorirhabdus singularis]MCX2982119.1 SDR family oxidoreductase [Candidatus Litorirhabdus singularis]
MKLQSELDGKVVVVTGGAGLIGKGFVRAVAENGGIAIIADVDETAGSKVRDELAADLGSVNIEFIKVDITSKKSVRGMIDSIISRHKVIDALVNNAYPRNENYGRKFEDVTYEDFCENVNLHLGGYFLMSQEVSRVMVKQKQGTIVNIASIYGFMAPRFELYEGASFTSPVEYSAIKGALLSLTKYLASYLGQHDIRVNAISPGGVHNNQPESFVKQYASKTIVGNRMAETDDLTGALVFLLGDSSRYITGQNIVVDGGWSI